MWVHITSQDRGKGCRQGVGLVGGLEVIRLLAQDWAAFVLVCWSRGLEREVL